MEARINRTEARISCSPWSPRQGKCGERIHNSSGIMTIRLIVMELGRFTVFPVSDYHHYNRLCAAYTRMLREERPLMKPE